MKLILTSVLYTVDFINSTRTVIVKLSFFYQKMLLTAVSSYVLQNAIIVYGNYKKAVRQQIVPLLQEMLTKIPTIDTVITTGHSLGGALAVICAFDLSIKFKKDKDLGEMRLSRLSTAVKRNIKCFTFGAPKVGNFYFRKAFHAKVGIENCIQGIMYVLYI